MTQVDKSVQEAYEDVRNDKTESSWAVFTYDGTTIKSTGTGNGGLNDLKNHLKNDERAYGFLRVTSGDEESKRAKFVFLSWCGPDVKALAKAKQSVDKAAVKDVIRNFAVEIHYTDLDEVNEERLHKQVIAAGGANYGTGGTRN